MTARLGRWLNSLEALEQRIARTPTVRRYGRLTRATGLVLEAVDFLEGVLKNGGTR